MDELPGWGNMKTTPTSVHVALKEGGGHHEIQC